MTERLEPSIPARSIFGTSPQSVQYMNLQFFKDKKEKNSNYVQISLIWIEGTFQLRGKD